MEVLIYFIIAFGADAFHNGCHITLDDHVSVSGYDTL